MFATLAVLETPEPGEAADGAVVTRGGRGAATTGDSAREKVTGSGAEGGRGGRKRVGDGSAETEPRRALSECSGMQR